MARPRTTDPDAVLDRAVEVFTRRGYADLGIAELVELLGVSRATLYADHGSKQGLWLAALDRYISIQGDGVARILTDPEVEPLERILLLLDAVAASLADDRTATCLVVNATCERGGMDGPTTAMVDAQLSVVTDLLADALIMARTAGQVAADLEIRSTAAMLAATIHGARVLGRLPSQRDTATQAIRHARDAVLGLRLEPGSPPG